MSYPLSETQLAIRAALLARVPVVLIGSPGIGKTAMITQIAKNLNYELIVILGSQMDPTDMTGNLQAKEMYRDENDTPVYGTISALPWWQIKALKDKKVMIFFDELSNTSDATRASMLSFFQDRILSTGQKLPNETLIIGAMNPPEEAADGYELDYATSNRLMFLVWEPTKKEWMDGMLVNWGAPMSKKEQYWKKVIVDFHKKNFGWIHKMPDYSDPNSYSLNNANASNSERAKERYAWPSNRSWDKLSKILSKANDDHVVQDLIISGTVGVNASIEFRRFLATYESFMDPEEVFNNPKSIDWMTIDLDKANYVMKAFQGYMGTEENALKILNVFKHVGEVGRADLGVRHMNDILASINKEKISSEGKEKLKALIQDISKIYAQEKKNS